MRARFVDFSLGMVVCWECELVAGWPCALVKLGLVLDLVGVR